MIKPPHLEPGDTVAVVSPSWGGPGAVRVLTADAHYKTIPVILTELLEVSG